MSAIDDLVERARRRIVRVGPTEAAHLQRNGALLVDTRPVALRRRHGEIPGSLVIDRNVLEWRLDPSSAHRHPALTDETTTVVVLCQEGYASSLAVDQLARLGLTDVRDLEGGFAAWEAAALPTRQLEGERAFD